MIDKNINDIEKDGEQMQSMLQELSKNDGEQLLEFQIQNGINIQRGS